MKRPDKAVLTPKAPVAVTISVRFENSISENYPEEDKRYSKTIL